MAIFQELLHPAHERTTFLQNAGQYLTHNTAWQPKRLNTFRKNDYLLSVIRIELHISLDIQPAAYHLYWLSYQSSQVFWVLLETPCFIQILHASFNPTLNSVPTMFTCDLAKLPRHDAYHVTYHSCCTTVNMSPTKRFEVFWDVMLCCGVSGNQHF